METYILELLPSLPKLEDLEESFYNFYICTAVRKFFFFLDPSRTRQVKIQDVLTCGFLDDLLDVSVILSYFIYYFINLFFFLPDTQMLASSNSKITQTVCSMYFFDALADRFLSPSAYILWLQLRDESLSVEKLENNWFSATSALRVYGQYLHLDKDHNGVLSKEELATYGTGTLTSVFIERVFQVGSYFIFVIPERSPVCQAKFQQALLCVSLREPIQPVLGTLVSSVKKGL